MFKLTDKKITTIFSKSICIVGYLDLSTFLKIILNWFYLCVPRNTIARFKVKQIDKLGNTGIG